MQVQDWLQEKKYFHQNLRTCIGGPCERYVQMMWYDAYKAGCAWKTCQGMKIHGYELKQAAVFAVCHYGPRQVKWIKIFCLHFLNVVSLCQHAKVRLSF